MTLFSPDELVSERRPLDHDQRRRCSIPTGESRLVGASARSAREKSWDALVGAVLQSSTARLELLKNRLGSDRTPCPWARLVDCASTCRCGGAREVTIEFLREHYMSLPVEIARLAAPRTWPPRKTRVWPGSTPVPSGRR